MKRVLVALMIVAVALLGALLYWGGQRSPAPISNARTALQPTQIPVYGYKIIKSYPHDPLAFTQGLVYENGLLYEGTGLYGQSTLRLVELETGTVLKLRRLAPQYFGEGITIWKDRIVQLTWQEKTGFVYDKTNFELLREFSYATEGWGITHDGQKLIMSDGSANLYFLDPETLQEIGRVTVKEHDKPVVRLNELEFIKGRVYANIWQTDRIAIISLETGQVEAWIDLTDLLKPEERTGREDVLNGIAYDAQGDRLFVTGKLWPKLFHIELTQPN
ncbi:MAG: glutaminyl-peptide cyclotransferase [Candidatus Bipolaricaulota bacterium]|nr:glutaminyl-peptide cyclotransferase [Candidatus Bipolaricaulota bacterium]MCS7275200.1 glutaminyl-peptide cyclotransferase [Candidatus Bipolaricaulota bacterium]MDW8111405.1 glutaminyl-peptide cyclotransferase [Candidatus Bipolaricaulota bacterium]MDW8329660.1 glutaminyl-peptide cyclotransferase [Candidatus Bipolaricaulota bacterium]